MKGLRFRLRTLLLTVVVVAIILSILETQRRRNQPRPLRANDGPFLGLAHTFRGQEAERHAFLLAQELRSEHGLPAYLYRIDKTRASSRSSSRLPKPTEVAVIIGDAKLIDEAERTRSRVLRIVPKSLVGVAGARRI